MRNILHPAYQDSPCESLNVVTSTYLSLVLVEGCFKHIHTYILVIYSVKVVTSTYMYLRHVLGEGGYRYIPSRDGANSFL